MKTILSLFAILASLACSHAATTINAANKYSYGANLGWMDWRGDAANGAVIGDYVCAGYVYSANVGWINLGGGASTNGIQYQNLSANDCGVNQDGLGNLRSYAYGADTDGDGLPDAWELTYTNSLPAFTATGDADGDGMGNLAEYRAGTDPNNAADNLRITSFQRGLLATPTQLDMQWTSQPTRQYAIQFRSDLTPSVWTDFAVLPALGTSGANWLDATDQQFYRIRAFRPLTP